MDVSGVMLEFHDTKASFFVWNPLSPTIALKFLVMLLAKSLYKRAAVLLLVAEKVP